jgi:hypothetical protein
VTVDLVGDLIADVHSEIRDRVCMGLTGPACQYPWAVGPFLRLGHARDPQQVEYATREGVSRMKIYNVMISPQGESGTGSRRVRDAHA